MKNGLIVGSNNVKYWYLNDLLHREDGPAIETSNGTKKWYLNGKRHRVDGPAIETSNGTKKWFLNGIEYIRVEYWFWNKAQKQVDK